METTVNSEIPQIEPKKSVLKLAPPKDPTFLKRSLIVACALLLLALILLAISFCSQYRTVQFMGVKKTWQAIFLTNGQVYFGHIVKEDGKAVVLRDIYYIQVQQLTPQAVEEEQQQPQMTLIKLGEELHGPTDEMRINRDHILFVEDLKPNSNVVRTIESAK